MFLSSIQTKAQVGINTSTPNPSSVLDINSTNKGVLLPQYDLSILNSTSTPVANPVDGLIIYNKGGLSTYLKGYYIWIRDRWERAIIGGSEPQIMSLYKKRDNPFTDPALVLVPTNSTNNAINQFSVASNRITNASLAADQSTINLPAGIYIFRYSVDTLTDNTSTTPANTTYFSKNLVCTRSYLIDATNNSVLTENNRMCQLTDVFNFYQGTFYITLTAPTAIKQKFEFDSGNGFVNNPLLVRSSFTLIITRMAQ